MKKNAHMVTTSPASNFKGTLNKTSSNRNLGIKNTNSVEKVYTKNFLMSLNGIGSIGPNINKKNFNNHKASIISSNQSVNSRWNIGLGANRPNNNPFNDI